MPSTPVGVFERLSSIDHLLARGEGVLEEFESALHGPDALAPDAAWTHPAGVVLTRDPPRAHRLRRGRRGAEGRCRAPLRSPPRRPLWWADGPHLRAHGDDESPTPPAALSRLAAHWREVFAARALPWAHALRPPQANPLRVAASHLRGHRHRRRGEGFGDCCGARAARRRWTSVTAASVRRSTGSSWRSRPTDRPRSANATARPASSRCATARVTGRARPSRAPSTPRPGRPTARASSPRRRANPGARRRDGRGPSFGARGSQTSRGCWWVTGASRPGLSAPSR